MARNIENAQDLKDVLDAIYNNNSQYDTYQNLTLYYNDITRTATIFTVDEEDEENTKNVIAVFNPENVVTQDNAFFVTLMKSATVNVSTEETSVYDFALGGYVNVDTLLKNICVALGVSLSNTFADANPSLYNDMINIIRNEYGQALENNAPYIMKKFVNLDTLEENYKSLVPLMCIVRIAIYLNNLGVFNTGDYDIQREISMSGDNYLWSVGYTLGVKGAMQQVYDNYNIDYPTFASIGMEVRDKNDFIDFVRKYYTQTIYDNQAPLITNGLDALTKFLDQYETEIDWTHYIQLSWTQTTSTATNTESVAIRTIPFDKVIQTTLDKRIGSTNNYGFGGVGGSSNISLTRIVKEDDTPTYTFSLTVSHNNTTQEDTITHNKAVSSFTKGFKTPSYGSTYFVFNIKPTKYVKPYCNTDSNDWYSLTGQLIVRFVDHFNRLVYNYEYKNLDLCYDVRYLMPYLDKAFLENNNFELHEGDLLYVAQSNGITNYIILREANIKGFTFNNALTYEGLLGTKGYVTPPVKNIGRYSGGQWTTYSQNPILATAWINPSESSNYSYQNINFSEPINIDIFKIAFNSSDYTVTVTTDQLTNQSSFNFYTYFNNTSFSISGNNIFQVLDIEQESTVEGLTLLPGATYPKNVIDLNSFNTIYPNWWKTQSNNPQIIDGVLAPTVTSTTWGAVAISQTTPSTQEDADSGEIDFTDTDIIDNIIDDIDNANEDNDIDTSATTEGDDNNGGSDEGNTPEIPSDSSLPLLAGSRVYAMTYGQVQGLVASMANPDMWELIAGGDVTRYIVSLQANQCWDGNGTQKAVVVGNLEAQYESEGQTYSVNGTEISGVDLYSNFNFGYADVPYKFNNYLDITNSKLTIYLPYVGFVDLDISEFIGRKLGLKAKVYLPTGDLMYFISSLDEESHTEQLKYIYTGNCSSEIPLSSNTSILNAFKNSINVGNVIGMVQDALGV